MNGKKRYALGVYEKAMPPDLSWRVKLESARDAGFDYVEISIDETEEKIRRVYMTNEERLEIIQAMYEAQTPIRSMCVSALTKYSLGNEELPYSTRGMEIFRRAIQLADDLGIHAVMIPGYDVYYGTSSFETKKRFLHNLKIATEIACAAGITVGLETMENEFMNTVEKAMKYVVLCKSHYLKIYPDIGNLTNASALYQMDLVEDMELGRGNITSLHLKETVPGKYRDVPYGQGHVDFERAISAAWGLGVRRYVAEFWYRGGEDWKKEMSDVNQRMRSILDRQSGGTNAP